MFQDTCCTHTDNFNPVSAWFSSVMPRRTETSVGALLSSSLSGISTSVNHMHPNTRGVIQGERGDTPPPFAFRY